jgi:hypothetical protein
MSLFTYSGKFKSHTYNSVFGIISIELPYEYQENFETILVLTYDNQSTHLPGQTKTFPMVGSYGHVKTETYEGDLYMLSPASNSLGQLFLLKFTPVPGEHLSLHGTYTCLNPHDAGSMIISCQTKCSGCLYDQPNQLAHMDYGGCLAQEDEILSDDPPIFDYRSIPQ